MSHIYETPSCELSIHLKVEYGKALYITGDTEIFGFWNLSNSKRLDWNTGDIWTIKIPIHAFQYKYFVADYHSQELYFWENGPNRHFMPTGANKIKVLDIWNHRKIKFLYYNPHLNQIYIWGSCQQLGSFQQKIKMTQKKEWAMCKITLDITQDQMIFYQYIQKDQLSQIQELKVSQQKSFHKSTIQVYYANTSKASHSIHKHNSNIHYGLVSVEKIFFKKVKKAGFGAIVEFCNDEESSTKYETKEGQTYITINLFDFKENTVQRLFCFVSLLIIKYEKIYICNNSLPHIKKYLEAYNKLISRSKSI